jgi:O-antigen/teichoic acid export membrane protein
LAGGTALSQAIPLAISPILTRLFTPEDFGLFAVYFGTLMIASVFATGKYELAIMLPTEKKNAKTVFTLSVLICVTVSLLFFIILIATKDFLLQLLNAEQLGWQILWLPMGVLGIGLSQSYYYYYNREAAYTSMAMIRIFRSCGYSVAALLGGLLAIPGTLIIADALGYLTAVLWTFRKTEKEESAISTFDEIKEAAKVYSNFPKFLIISGILEKGSGQAPVFILSNLFMSMSGAGFFSFAQRIIITPADVLARAIGDVFRQQASEAYAKSGTCEYVFRKTALKLFSIGVLPFTIAFLAAEPIFSFVFGPAWSVAGTYAEIMMPMFFLQFIASPISVMFIIAGKQQYDLIIQIVLFLAIVCSFVLGSYLDLTIIQTLQIFNAVYCLKYALEFYLSHRFSKRK